MTSVYRVLGLVLFLLISPRLVHADQVLYVANENSGTIRRFSSTGTDLGVFESGLTSPGALTTDSSGNLYVSGGPGINKYSAQGNLLLSIATSYTTGGIVVASDGTIDVNDYFGGRVYHYSATGQSLGVLANLGLYRADFLTADSSENLYVTDFGGGVVRKISSTGQDLGNFLTNVQGIEGIKFDNQGNFYAAIGNSIHEYSSTGSSIRVFPTAGLNNPYGITFGPDNNLYVANFGDNTVHEFSPTGQDLGTFASTGLNGARDVAFGVATVPEPTSLILVGLGLVGAAAMGYGKSRSGRKIGNRRSMTFRRHPRPEILAG